MATGCCWMGGRVAADSRCGRDGCGLAGVACIREVREWMVAQQRALGAAAAW